MKKWMKWFCASLIALVAVLSVSCNRHEYNPTDVGKPTSEDSTQFAILEDMKNNPHFSSTFDVCRYQQVEGEKRAEDSIFFSIPKNVLANVSQVLLNRNEPLTKENIVKEFVDGKKIYLNLKKIDQFKSLDPPDEDNNYDSLETITNDKE